MNGLYKTVNNEVSPITREWQKIKIAEIYHTKYQKQEFIILTNKELSKNTEYSINWLNEYRHQVYQEEELVNFVSKFLKVFDKDPLNILNDVLKETAFEVKLPFSACLNMFRYCGTKHYLPLDITQRITLSTTLKMNYDESRWARYF